MEKEKKKFMQDRAKELAKMRSDAESTRRAFLAHEEQKARRDERRLNFEAEAEEGRRLEANRGKQAQGKGKLQEAFRPRAGESVLLLS